MLIAYLFVVLSLCLACYGASRAADARFTSWLRSLKSRVVVAAVVAPVAMVGALIPESSLSVDPERSQVVIHVGKAGLFGFAGHDHEVIAPAVRGTVTFDPIQWQRSSVELAFDASALKVTGKGDPPGDVPQVQRVMLSDKVLDVERFPTIAFRSREVTVLSRRGNAADLQIEGDLTLHGVTRPTRIRATATFDPVGAVSARGAFTLKQTEFGMEPVTAAGGTVRVKDVVDVQFLLVARH